MILSRPGRCIRVVSILDDVAGIIGILYAGKLIKGIAVGILGFLPVFSAIQSDAIHSFHVAVVIVDQVFVVLVTGAKADTQARCR